MAHLKWPEQRQPPRGHPAESVYRCNQCRDTVYCCIIRNYLLTYLHAYLPTYLLTYLLTDLLTYLLTYLAYLPTYLPDQEPDQGSWSFYGIDLGI